MDGQLNQIPETPAAAAPADASAPVNAAAPAGAQPNYGAQPDYGAQPNYAAPQAVPYGAAPVGAPVVPRKTNKGLLKYILLSLITFGIYGLVVMSSVSDDINVIASRYDGKKTMHYCLMFFLVGPFTLGIGFLVWYNNISARIGNELRRRMIPYDFGAGTFWLWCILGSLILVGPFVYYHKLFKATNMLCENYNMNG